MKKHCHYCGGETVLQKDHVIPKIRGGVSWVWACRRCNQSKGDSTPAEWLDRLIRSNNPSDKYRWKRIKEQNRRRSNWFARIVHTRERRGF